MVLWGQVRFRARDEVVECAFFDGQLRGRLELGPEQNSARKLDLELAGVLSVGAVAVLVRNQTANDDLDDRLPIGRLRKVAVMAGNDD